MEGTDGINEAFLCSCPIHTREEKGGNFYTPSHPGMVLLFVEYWEVILIESIRKKPSYQKILSQQREIASSLQDRDR